MTELQEFRSKLEDIMPAEELFFEPTPGFGFYEPWLEHAGAHPAKMNTWLLEFLIKAYTKEGDTVLDPMAGSGSIGVVAALHGRNAIQVELEKKFYEWMEQAKENVEKTETPTPKGRIVNICGDARRLSELLNGVGFEPTTVVTSPPYGETYTGGGDPEKRRERLIKAGHDPKDFLGGKARNAVLKHYGEVDVCLTPPPYSNAISKQGGPTGVKNVGISTITARSYSDNKDNIGNLPHGEINAIITSPPYADGFRHNPQNAEKRIEKLVEVEKKAVERGQKWAVSSEEAIKRRYAQQDLGYGRSKENIGNLPLGEINAIITSPPYAEANRGGGIAVKGYEGKYGKDEKLHLRHDRPLSDNPNNISNLPFGSINCCITNPPYAECPSSVYEELGQRIKELFKEGKIMKNGKPTYLSEILKVYGEMFKVLKPGGLAIVVVKPFVRNKKVVDLSLIHI